MGTIQVVQPTATPVSGQASTSWRPPQWNGGKAQTVLTVPISSQPAPVAGTNPLIGTIDGQPLPSAPAYVAPIVYVFDAILRISHQSEIRRTEFPIQTGSNVTDHAVRRPARVTMEIGMSDAMSSFTPNSWSGKSSKSVNAYQTLVELQKSRVLVSLATRLLNYDNLLIESITAQDSFATVTSLRATIIFSEVFLASVSATSEAVKYDLSDLNGSPSVSAREHTTGGTQVGQTQTQTVSQAIQQQHQVVQSAVLPSAPVSAQAGANINALGAGKWDSGTVLVNVLTSPF